MLRSIFVDIVCCHLVLSFSCFGLVTNQPNITGKDETRSPKDQAGVPQQFKRETIFFLIGSCFWYRLKKRHRRLSQVYIYIYIQQNTNFHPIASFFSILFRNVCQHVLSKSLRHACAVSGQHGGAEAVAVLYGTWQGRELRRRGDAFKGCFTDGSESIRASQETFPRGRSQKIQKGRPRPEPFICATSTQTEAPQRAWP